MAYVIGPDGQLIDDGKAIGPEPVNLTSADMTPEMLDAVLGYKSQGDLHQRGEVVPPSPKLVDPFAFHPAILDSNFGQNLGQELAQISHMKSGEGGKNRVSKASYSESGPNGVVPGNSDPYNVPTGTGNQQLAQARGGLGEMAAAQEDAIDLQGEAGAENLAIDKQEFAARGLVAEQQQDMELRKAGMMEHRRAQRMQMSMKAKEDAVKRITDWNNEAEAAANTEVDPNRYWNNRSNFSKISFALGALAGGMAGKTGAENDSLTMLQTAIGRDINAQNDKIQRKMKFLEDKRGNIDLLNNLDRLGIEDLDQDTMDWIKEFDVKLSATNKEIDKITAKFGADRVAPQLKELQAKILQGKADIRTALYSKDYEAAEKKIDRELTVSENAKNRAHQSAMQQRERKWAIEDRDAKAAAALAEAEATGWIETGTVGGFTERDGHRDGKIKINPTLGPADITDFVGKAQALKQEYGVLNELKDYLKGRDITELVLMGTDGVAVVEDAVSQLVYERSGKAATDEERKAMRKILTGAGGAFEEFARTGDANGPINRAIDANVSRGQDLYSIYAVPGSGAIYDPKDTNKSKGGADTGADLNSLVAEWSGKTGTANKAHGDVSAKKRKTDALDYDAATNAIDLAAEKGDVASIESAIDQLAAIDIAEMASDDARHPMSAKYSPQRRILNYATAKLNALKGKGDGKVKPDIMSGDTHEENMNDYYQGSYSGYDL